MIKAVGISQYSSNITADTAKEKKVRQSDSNIFFRTDSFVRTEESFFESSYEGMSQQQIKEQLFKEFIVSGGTVDAFQIMIDKSYSLGIITGDVHKALGELSARGDIFKEETLSELFYNDYLGVLMGYYETINTDIKENMFDKLTDSVPDGGRNRERQGMELDYRRETRAFMAELRAYMEQNGLFPAMFQ